MAGEWTKAPFDEMAQLAREVVQPEEVPGLPYIALEHIGEGSLSLVGLGQSEDATSTKTRFNAGDILFGKLRPYFRKLVRPRFDGICSTDIWVVRPRPGVDAGFLFYLMASDLFVKPIVRASEGTKMPRAQWAYAAALDLPRPPPPEQRAIAYILGTLDDKIELNRRANETLEAMARALFKSWFVHFDPVRAKAEGRDVGLPQPLADLFPDAFEDSELGEIPRGWEVASIYEIADVVYGAPFASAQFNAEGLGEPLIRIRDLANESPGVWTPEVHAKGYKVHAGDIVVGMDGEFRAYLWGGAEAWLNQRVCVFVPKGGASAAFVRNSIIEPLAHVESTETATTVIHLGKADIDRFSIVLPPGEILAAFNENCQPWYERIGAGKQESRTLAALRDALLPKLISGELRVEDPARFLGGGD